jgi:hypothetical protein
MNMDIMYENNKTPNNNIMATITLSASFRGLKSPNPTVEREVNA